MWTCDKNGVMWVFFSWCVWEICYIKGGICKRGDTGEHLMKCSCLLKFIVCIDNHQWKLFVQVFYEEELDVPLVLFDEVLDHVLRIDRIFRQPQGHLLLIGVSGAGKTTLSRFVAWMNGLSIFQIKVSM